MAIVVAVLRSFVRRHADVVGRGFSARPHERHVLPHRQLHTSAQRCLDRRLIDLAVALCGVPIADLEQRARHEHRDEERAAGDELSVVEIACMLARRVAAHAAGRGRRRNAHAAEERPQRNHDAPA
jgi:hypothetical protein